MQNALLEHSAILSTFIKLSYGFKTFVSSIFWVNLKAGFTVLCFFSGCFVMYFFVVGTLKSYGILYTEIDEHFNVGSGPVAFISSIFFAFLFGLGKYMDWSIGREGVGQWVRTPPPWKTTNGYRPVSLEKLVRTPLDKQLVPSSPIAYRGRSVQPSVKYVADKKKAVRTPHPPLMEFSGVAHASMYSDVRKIPSNNDVYLLHFTLSGKMWFLCTCFCNATSDWITSKNLLCTVGRHELRHISLDGMWLYAACNASIETRLQKCIRMEITIFKIFIWGDISSDIRSEI